MLKFNTITLVFILSLAGALLYDIQGNVSPWFYFLLPFFYSLLLFYGVSTLSAGFFIPAQCHGPRDGKDIALTFDDGPHPGLTDGILDILKSHQVKAAFFCMGKRAEAHPDILKRMASEGHIVGNHSFYHGRFFDLQSKRAMQEELEKTDEAIAKAIGHTPAFFRPPYGVINPNLSRAVRAGHYTVVGWSVRSFDTVARQKDKLFQRVAHAVKGGDIVLFHDHVPVTHEILDEFIVHVKKLGLNIVGLDELLNRKPYSK